MILADEFCSLSLFLSISLSLVQLVFYFLGLSEVLRSLSRFMFPRRHSLSTSAQHSVYLPSFIFLISYVCLSISVQFPRNYQRINGASLVGKISIETNQSINHYYSKSRLMALMALVSCLPPFHPCFHCKQRTQLNEPRQEECRTRTLST